MEIKKLDLKDINALKLLRAGELVELSGELYTARDAAHKRLYKAINSGDKLPIELKNAVIFYVGPIFGENGKAVSAGPTTAMRMDAYAPTLYDNGVLATIGKGNRSTTVYNAVKRNGALYFAAIGGAGALYGDAIKSVECVAYQDLGTEAIYRFIVKDFPVLVAIDIEGNSIYSE